jgi:16S rRNA (guanine527-N7)-methyltransferase
MSALIEQLQAGCQSLEIVLTAEQQQKLLAYVMLMAKWNKVYNLTSIREPEEMVTRHLLDSLAVLPYLSAQSLLDVGTGGGLPGIPMAIMQPEMQVTLLDSNSKKTRFLQQVKAELKLDNVEVVHSRVESAKLPQFAIVTARAFATIDDIISLAGRHCQNAGQLILMKGQYPQQELQITMQQFVLKDVIELAVPFINEHRHLVRLIKQKG